MNKESGMMLKEIMAEVMDMLEKKHVMYGEKNLEKHGTEGILIRLDDKLSRLRTMESRRLRDTQESREDTAKDMIGYLLQYLRLIRKQPETKSETVRNIVEQLSTLKFEEKKQLLKELDALNFQKPKPQETVRHILDEVEKIFSGECCGECSKSDNTVLQFEQPLTVGNAKRILQTFFPDYDVVFDKDAIKFYISDAKHKNKYEAVLATKSLTITPAVDVEETILRRVAKSFNGWVEW